MTQPHGFVNSNLPNHVCKINKAIYKLRQASYTWYDELKSYLILLAFKPTIFDPSLFILKIESLLILFHVYMDGIIITGPSPTHPSKFVSHLSTKLSLKDLGALSYFLAVEVIPHSHGIIRSQT